MASHGWACGLRLLAALAGAGTNNELDVALYPDKLFQDMGNARALKEHVKAELLNIVKDERCHRDVVRALVVHTDLP
jgi:hypothetical protein